MVFAVFDHDSLVSAMQRIWDKLAPRAMFTAVGNSSLRNSDVFGQNIEMLKWDMVNSQDVALRYGENYGFQGNSLILPNYSEGSNSIPIDKDKDGIVDEWDAAAQVYAPPGFGTITGANIVYADTLPPFDITLTFGNEYGQAAFQKIYDVDILNEGSGVSVDTVVME